MEERIFIYPKDIMRITGKKKSFASSQLQTCKDALGKKKDQGVTFKEYANYYDIELDLILTILKIKP